MGISMERLFSMKRRIFYGWSQWKFSEISLHLFFKSKIEKNCDKLMEKYIHFGLLCVLICAFTKNINFIPFKRNWQVFFACASICFKHRFDIFDANLPLTPVPSPWADCPAMFLRCKEYVYQARALRALGLLLADGTPTVGGEKTFWAVSKIFLRKQL